MPASPLQNANGVAKSLLQLLYAILVLYMALMCTEAFKSRDKRCPTGFANFGDSLTDTGNTLNVFPYDSDAENPPYGQTFFGAPAKRFSNGRVIPDFFSLAFDVPLLDGYFATVSFDYRFGVNFAMDRATAIEDKFVITITTAPNLFNLPHQINQFIRFKNSVNSTSSQIACADFLPTMPEVDAFPGWLYTLQFGGNDIFNALTSNMPMSMIKSTIIPAIVNTTITGIQTLYEQSARKFLLFGIPAQGCSTVTLTLFHNRGFPVDSFGCIKPVNDLIKVLNGEMLAAIQNLRLALSDANIAYFDYYHANIEILQNPQIYGLDPNVTKKTCCGAAGVGKLNHNANIKCGRPGANVCANPNKYVIWDGFHFTEQFYRHISEFALSGRFTDHGTNYVALCGLNFTSFGNELTYQQLYGVTSDQVFL